MYLGRIPDKVIHPGISETIILEESIFPNGIDYTVQLVDDGGNREHLPWWIPISRTKGSY